MSTEVQVLGGLKDYSVVEILDVSVQAHISRAPSSSED